MSFETILERMAAIHRQKNTNYGSSYNLAPASPPAGEELGRADQFKKGILKCKN